MGDGTNHPCKWRFRIREEKACHDACLFGLFLLFSIEKHQYNEKNTKREEKEDIAICHQRRKLWFRWKAPCLRLHLPDPGIISNSSLGCVDNSAGKKRNRGQNQIDARFHYRKTLHFQMYTKQLTIERHVKKGALSHRKYVA